MTVYAFHRFYRNIFRKIDSSLVREHQLVIRLCFKHCHNHSYAERVARHAIYGIGAATQGVL